MANRDREESNMGDIRRCEFCGEGGTMSMETPEMSYVGRGYIGGRDYWVHHACLDEVRAKVEAYIRSLVLYPAPREHSVSWKMVK